MSETYDIRPSDADLDDENLAKQEADDFRCRVVGAHSYILICGRCGKQQSKYHEAEYLETD